MMIRDKDGYGRVISEYHRGQTAPEIIERDDGWFDVSSGGPSYFAPFKDWPAHQRQAIRYVKGRVLDIGCGAGRVALHLQEKNHEVVAIDVSPNAVKTCSLRGVRDARVMSITQVSRRLGEFDTIVMFGNNFGLFGGMQRARWLLKRFHRCTSSDAKIIAESGNPHETKIPEHRRYLSFNRKRGRMPGQLRIRVRSGHACTPFFDYLLASPREMRTIVNGTGWRVANVIAGDESAYAAVIEKVAV
jgi:SAM-dependent methyltransferase